MNELIVKEYLGNSIEFKMVDGVVYANANKMASGFGGSKKLADWKRSENTKRYIEALEKAYGNSHMLIKSEKTNIEYGGGTWIHEKLILNFARYLNVEFEVYCDIILEKFIANNRNRIINLIDLDEIPESSIDNSGYVYGVKNMNTGYIKIGASKDINKRLCQLQVANTDELQIVYISELVDNMYELEKEYHNVFKNKLIRGEWFNINESNMFSV